ncbi:MAG TPA: sugar phosphate isomerase/epimerase family protein [bacterium]|nr:sugar phosphate isomerase/epimerase family protein [bacterium]
MKFFIHKKVEDIIVHNMQIPEIIGNIVDGIEVVITEPFFFRNDCSEKIRKISDFCMNMDVSVHLPFYDLNLGSVDRNISEYSFRSMVQGIDIASGVGAEIAVAHLGYNVLSSKSSTAKWFERFAVMKGELEKHAADKGVTVVWENTYEKEMAVFDEMIKVHPGTKFCLDIGHCNCFAGFSAVEFIERYKERVMHIHLHDNDGIEDSHLAPGKGNIDFLPIMEKIMAYHVRNAVFELDFDKFTDSVDHISEIFLKKRK